MKHCVLQMFLLIIAIVAAPSLAAQPSQDPLKQIGSNNKKGNKNPSYNSGKKNGRTGTTSDKKPKISNAQKAKNLYKKGMDCYNSRKFEEAVNYYKQAANLGYVEAQYKLGYCYYDGIGVEPDHTEAVTWYRKAAEQGYICAQEDLGLCYYKGIGVTQNYELAAKWLYKVAEQGNTSVGDELGYCYYYTKNYAEAAKWFKKMEDGNAEIQYLLGVLYFKGYDVEKNYTEAEKWLKKAAEQGYRDAEVLLQKLTNK